jgi:L-rhamnose isomerase
MRLRIINEPKRFSVTIVRDAAKYYAERLLKDRSVGVNITIDFIDSFDNKIAAYCIWTDDIRRPRNFKIVLENNMRKSKTLECLAHEMVHVKQFVFNEMRDYTQSDDHVKWYGKKTQYDNSNDEMYYDSPWEIEAYGRQIGLYRGFKKSLKDRKPS